MKFIFIMLSFVTCINCMQSNKMKDRNSKAAEVEQTDRRTMSQNIIKLKTGESADLLVPSRGAVPVRLHFEMEPEEILKVERHELKTEQIPADAKPGDPMPAYYQITALKKGEVQLEYFELPIGAPEDRKTTVRKYLILIE